MKRNQAAFFSKYAKGIVCPHPKYEEEHYIDFLINLGEHLPLKGVLFPTGDTETLALLKHRKRLEPYYHFTMADYPIVNRLINKRLFYELLEKNNIPYPVTFFPNDEEDAKKAGRKLSYPCIVKPVYPTYFRLDFNTKLFVAKSSEEMLSFYKKASQKRHQVMLQEIIPGDATAMFGFNAYYDRKGISHGNFMYRRIREWPLGFGNGCYIQSVQEPVLGQITGSFMKILGYYGIVDAEFKYDSRNGLFKFIEVNPRIWMQNSFPSRYGHNLPYFAYLDVLGKKLPGGFARAPNESIRWVYLLEDIQSSKTSMQKRSLSILRWIKTFRFDNEYAIFSWDDPFPFFYLGCQSISTLLYTLLRKPS